MEGFPAQAPATTPPQVQTSNSALRWPSSLRRGQTESDFFNSIVDVVSWPDRNPTHANQSAMRTSFEFMSDHHSVARQGCEFAHRSRHQQMLADASDRSVSGLARHDFLESSRTAIRAPEAAAVLQLGWRPQRAGAASIFRGRKQNQPGTRRSLDRHRTDPTWVCVRLRG
jgi:hypothetical protein